jgi:hypothetical protein
VASSCKYSDEPAGSGGTELVILESGNYVESFKPVVQLQNPRGSCSDSYHKQSSHTSNIVRRKNLESYVFC